MTAARSFPNIRQRRVPTNNIELNIAEQGEGPLIIMCHGFPESWYSWRHQFQPLADVGYHVVAPDMRGYGESDKPQDIKAYNQVEVVADIMGLIPALGYESAIVFGHDWGAPTAWSCALHHPELVTAVGALSVPFSPRGEMPPLDMLEVIFKDQFFYQLYFQAEGVAERELEADVRRSLRLFYHMASGQMDLTSLTRKGPDADLLTGLPDPEVMGPWLSDDDLDFYVQEFEHSGFRGPLSYYRNLNETWAMTAGAPTQIEQPAMFTAGDKDGVIMMAPEALKNMPTHVLDLRINDLIPGAGHWTQQEAPTETTALMLQVLEGL